RPLSEDRGLGRAPPAAAEGRFPSEIAPGTFPEDLRGQVLGVVSSHSPAHPGEHARRFPADELVERAEIARAGQRQQLFFRRFRHRRSVRATVSFSGSEKAVNKLRKSTRKRSNRSTIDE